MGDLKHDRVHTGYDLEEEYFYHRNEEAKEKFRLRLIKGGKYEEGSSKEMKDEEAPPGRQKAA